MGWARPISELAVPVTLAGRVLYWRSPATAQLVYLAHRRPRGVGG